MIYAHSTGIYKPGLVLYGLLAQDGLARLSGRSKTMPAQNCKPYWKEQHLELSPSALLGITSDSGIIDCLPNLGPSPWTAVSMMKVLRALYTYVCFALGCGLSCFVHYSPSTAAVCKRSDVVYGRRARGVMPLLHALLQQSR